MVSLSNHVAISLRLSTRRRTIIATASRLPRCARNDRLKWVHVKFHRASGSNQGSQSEPITVPVRTKKRKSPYITGIVESIGAEDGIRTRDLLLGKETLYH